MSRLPQRQSTLPLPHARAPSTTHQRAPSSSHNHPTNTSTSTSTNPPSLLPSPLQSRILAKRAELDNLVQLRALSADLAGQMASLEDKLANLRDGTEAVALVLANWGNVLRAIQMAALKVAQTRPNAEAGGGADPEVELPTTLVRIPVKDEEEVREEGEGEGESADGSAGTREGRARSGSGE